MITNQQNGITIPVEMCNNFMVDSKFNGARENISGSFFYTNINVVVILLN